MKDAKSSILPKKRVVMAYNQVKSDWIVSSKDRTSLWDFDKDRRNRLYKLWNRMCSGTQLLGLAEQGILQHGLRKPTFESTVAQSIVLLSIQHAWETNDQPGTNGYAMNKSAQEALLKARMQVQRHPWVLVIVLKDFYNAMEYGTLRSVIEKYIDCPWGIVFIKRWLSLHGLIREGKLVQRQAASLEDSLIGPFLANLFLHHVFDRWMKNQHASLAVERFGPEILVHCASCEQAQRIQAEIKQHLLPYKLEFRAQKTKTVPCIQLQDAHPQAALQFDFLGHCFKQRKHGLARGSVVWKFSPAISLQEKRKIGQQIQRWKLQAWYALSLEEIAERVNPMVQSWINQCGLFNARTLKEAFRKINWKLTRWIQRKFKGFRRHKKRAAFRLGEIARSKPSLFTHWTYGVHP